MALLEWVAAMAMISSDSVQTGTNTGVDKVFQTINPHWSPPAEPVSGLTPTRCSGPVFSLHPYGQGVLLQSGCSPTVRVFSYGQGVPLRSGCSPTVRVFS